MVKAHNCRITGARGEYTYLCSRCGQCYVCKHTALFMSDSWVWKTRDRGKIKFEPVINDGRLVEVPGSQP